MQRVSNQKRLFCHEDLIRRWRSPSSEGGHPQAPAAGPTALSACRGPAQPRQSPVCWGLQLLSPLWSPESQQAGTLPVRFYQRSTSARCVCASVWIRCQKHIGSGHKHTNKKTETRHQHALLTRCISVRRYESFLSERSRTGSPPLHQRATSTLV